MNNYTTTLTRTILLKMDHKKGYNSHLDVLIDVVFEVLDWEPLAVEEDLHTSC
jgi:hypothetical protein